MVFIATVWKNGKNHNNENGNNRQNKMEKTRQRIRYCRSRRNRSRSVQRIREKSFNNDGEKMKQELCPDCYKVVEKIIKPRTGEKSREWGMRIIKKLSFIKVKK